MKQGMKVEAQTQNAANIINFETVAYSSSDVFLKVIHNLESDCFEDYVMCYPDKFMEAKTGIDNYVATLISNEINSLSIPKDMRRLVSITASTMVSTYVLEEYIIEMVEGYRDEALAEFQDEYEYEDEDIAWDRHLESE